MSVNLLTYVNSLALIRQLYFILSFIDNYWTLLIDFRFLIQSMYFLLPSAEQTSKEARPPTELCSSPLQNVPTKSSLTASKTAPVTGNNALPNLAKFVVC